MRRKINAFQTNIEMYCVVTRIQMMFGGEIHNKPERSLALELCIVKIKIKIIIGKQQYLFWIKTNETCSAFYVE